MSLTFKQSLHFILLSTFHYLCERVLKIPFIFLLFFVTFNASDFLLYTFIFHNLPDSPHTLLFQLSSGQLSFLNQNPLQIFSFQIHKCDCLLSFSTLTHTSQKHLKPKKNTLTSPKITSSLCEVFRNNLTKMGLTVGNDETPVVGEKREELKTIWRNKCP